MQAIPKLAHTQSLDDVDDYSVELFELSCFLDVAPDAFRAARGYKICIRCAQQFDEYTKRDCIIRPTVWFVV